jgi:copper homeostasis protein
LKFLKSKLSIPIYVMIRPHAETFCYQDLDFARMKATITSLKYLGADGFVFGILNEVRGAGCNHSHSWVDVSRNKELVQLADGLPCTFHRAFDLIPESEWNVALAEIMDCGFTSILTSGGPSGTKAIDCAEKLALLVHWQNEQTASRAKMGETRVPNIIVGGGVRASNIGQLRRLTAASVFHSAALRASDGTFCESEVLALKDQLNQSDIQQGH